MSYKEKKKLVDQVSDTLRDQLAIGESKHHDKIAGTTESKIYSWETYHTYKNACDRFVKWCRTEYKCKTLEQCRPHAQEWMDSLDASASTKYTWASALGKLYGCSYRDVVDKLPTRKRVEITRSRDKAVRDAHFSESRNADLVTFARSTGLRRSELKALRGDKLVSKDGKLFIDVSAGSKGGRRRLAPVIGGADAEAVVTRLMTSAGSGKVFAKIPSCADIHGYRAEYATAIYNAHARPLEVCEVTPYYNREHGNGAGVAKGGWDSDSVYRCRNDLAGLWFDKAAMQKASEALGHNRISVVAGHYLRR